MKWKALLVIGGDNDKRASPRDARAVIKRVGGLALNEPLCG